MNYITIGIGALVCSYGILSGIFWFIKPEWFAKKEAMKDKWGNTAGSILHFTSYIIVPLILGGILIFGGITGISLKEVFAS